MNWYNEPKKWQSNNIDLEVSVEAATDFWQITHYGFIRDNGHFYYQEMEGNFIAEVKITGKYKDLYDQAGLMIRIDDKNWIKTGIEYVKPIEKLSVVVTREFSDWSVVPLSNASESIYFKLLRQDDFVEIFYSFNQQEYTALRLAYFPPQVKVQIGMMCAAPDGTGFDVLFEGFKVEGVKS